MTPDHHLMVNDGKDILEMISDHLLMVNDGKLLLYDSRPSFDDDGNEVLTDSKPSSKQ